MLSVPKLDDLGYDKLFERARSQIHMYTDTWTDLNYHDPGITTLQTFAWLVDTLNYYIDATGEQHRLKYLSLLGLRPERSAASCHIAITGGARDISLARGAKLTAGGTVFELAESYLSISNEMIALFGENSGQFLNLTPFAGVDGEYAAVFTCDREQESALYIGFERELKETVRFYVDVLPHPKRIPFSDDFALSELLWEYYDGGRWQPAVLHRDDTSGFLRSGFISLALESATKPVRAHPILPDGHYLRAKLIRNEYDALPKIGRMHLNCVQAVQTDTCAQSLEYVCDGSSELVIDYHVRENDVVCVAVGDGDGYSLWFEHVMDADSLCEVKTGGYPWQRIIYFDRERFGAFPEEGRKILVTVTDADSYDKLQLGVTTGFARERMELDMENLYELRLALVEEKDGRPFYRIWDGCDNISGQACDARVFQYDQAGGEIVFGDGIAGMQPEAGQLVVAITAKSSLLDSGNVRREQVNHLLDKACAGISVRNPEDAFGGKRPKTSQEMEQEIEGKIYKTARAVTNEDYIKIIKNTPGLIIDGVNVISSKDYAKYYRGQHPNSVMLVVKPYSEHEKYPVLSDAYRRRIRGHIERYRLLTTDVRILPARYVSVEVDGRIVLAENTPLTRARIEETLSELIDGVNINRFGRDIVYGMVFSRIELLDCVSKVSQLSFSCIGEGAHKDEQGNIVVYPDAMSYPGKINIEYV